MEAAPETLDALKVRAASPDAAVRGAALTALEAREEPEVEELLLERFAGERDSDLLHRVGALLEKKATRRSAVQLHRMIAGGTLGYYQRAVAATLFEKLTAREPLTEREEAQSLAALVTPPARSARTPSGALPLPPRPASRALPSWVGSAVVLTLAAGLGLLAAWSQSDRLGSAADSPTEASDAQALDLHAVATASTPGSFVSRRVVAQGTIASIDRANRTVIVQKGQDSVSAVVPAASLAGLSPGDAIEVHGTVVGRSRFGMVFVQDASCARR